MRLAENWKDYFNCFFFNYFERVKVTSDDSPDSLEDARPLRFQLWIPSTRTRRCALRCHLQIKNSSPSRRGENQLNLTFGEFWVEFGFTLMPLSRLLRRDRWVFHLYFHGFRFGAFVCVYVWPVMGFYFYLAESALAEVLLDQRIPNR